MKATDSTSWTHQVPWAVPAMLAVGLFLAITVPVYSPLLFGTRPPLVKDDGSDVKGFEGDPLLNGLLREREKLALATEMLRPAGLTLAVVKFQQDGKDDTLAGWMILTYLKGFLAELSALQAQSKVVKTIQIVRWDDLLRLWKDDGGTYQAVNEKTIVIRRNPGTSDAFVLNEPAGLENQRDEPISIVVERPEGTSKGLCNSEFRCRRFRTKLEDDTFSAWLSIPAKEIFGEGPDSSDITTIRVISKIKQSVGYTFADVMLNSYYSVENADVRIGFRDHQPTRWKPLVWHKLGVWRVEVDRDPSRDPVASKWGTTPDIEQVDGHTWYYYTFKGTDVIGPLAVAYKLADGDVQD